MSQLELSERLGVSQATVSNWERGTASLRGKELRRVELLLGSMGSETETRDLDSEASPFGVWLNMTRIKKGLTVHELAEGAGVTAATIYNLEAGRIANPQSKTREGLAQALGQDPSEDTVEATEEAAVVKGIGTLTDFDPHDAKELPQGAGVYVFYDISQRPVYVGKSGDLRSRIRSYSDKFWFKRPIVEYGSYIIIEDRRLREQVEEVLIKFLKNNAVLNIQHVER
jgi:transcriptional regulator with XRE-family HTH domain